MTKTTGSIALAEYAAGVAPTDVLDPHSLQPVLLGLYGEVGGIMATAKKHIRDGTAYPGYTKAAREEFGDTLWYLAAIYRRTGNDLDGLLIEAASGQAHQTIGVACDLVGGTCASVAIPLTTETIDERLFKLGRSAAALLDGQTTREKLLQFARDYLEALHGAKLAFADVVRSNLLKTRGAFMEPETSQLIDFDADKFGPDEQLPQEFEIRISQRPSGKAYLQWKGVFIGDPLTDNIGDPDGYRFHDVLHLANAAILHWSPVMRALIKHKRKSIASYDEAEDGGRAIVVEEGVTAWIFTQAKDLNFFAGQDRVSLGLLKSIGEFVRGFEVEKCPLKLWERSILQGYDVFRKLRDAQGGWIIGSRTQRTIAYKPLDWKS